MNSNIDPVRFARSYLAELNTTGTGNVPVQPEKTAAEISTEDTWYTPDSKTVPEKPPTLAQFDRDIKKLQESNASEKNLNTYCGLSLLTSVMVAAANAGSVALAGPLFIGLATSIGKTLAGPGMEQEIARENAAVLINQQGISTDPALNERFTTICGKILAQSDLDSAATQCIVLNSETINAHSLPGFLFITKGMLEQFTDDGHLAFFIGHEVAHAENRDTLEEVGQQMFYQLAVSSTLLKSKTRVGETGKTVAEYRNAVKESYYSATLAHDRANETSADTRGAELLLKAGFSADDARKAITTIVKIEEIIIKNTLRKQLAAPDGTVDEAQVEKKFAEHMQFNTHPSLAERLAAVEKAVG